MQNNPLAPQPAVPRQEKGPGADAGKALSRTERFQGRKILFVSLGCDKNLVDTEKMMALLAKDGWQFTDDEAQAEVIVINSCCFIGDAKEESIRTILEMAQMRTEGVMKALVVTGCLSERYREEVLEQFPEVDAVLGISAWQELPQVLAEIFSESGERAVSETGRCRMLPNDRFYSNSTDRILTTGGHYAFLKIAEGCDKHCTYCVIPSVRGGYRSVPMEELEEEARKLADAGVRELILVAQETTLYGTDLYGRKMLPELVRRLCRIPGLAWIRLMYCYPEEITGELIRVIREEPKVCHYLDMPIQHASDAVLKRMGRRATRSGIREIVRRVREEIPDIVLRTTVITGFPGETEADFRELLSFVDEMEFERLGVFPYSAEEGTPAALMGNQVPEETRLSRRDRVMELQQEISRAVEESCVGASFLVFIEGKLEHEDAFVGRTYMDAPGVDGYFFVKADEELMSGTFVSCTVTGADEYDLTGVMDHEDESAQ